MEKYRIAIFASGNGSNAEKIIQYFQDHTDIEVALVLTNNPNAGVLSRARKLSIHSIVFDRAQFAESGTILQWLDEARITHIVLAGFLWLVPNYLIERYRNKIINIHPALLPDFGGKGMYGMKVHEAVRAAGAKETGITIHLVDEHYDNGKIVFQGRCEVTDNCSASDIAQRVHALEYEHYAKVIEKWILEKQMD